MRKLGLVLTTATMLALAACSLAGGASASAANFKTYVGCSTSEHATPSNLCHQGDHPGAFFEDESADVSYVVCVSFPIGNELCTGEEEALRGVLYVNKISLAADAAGSYNVIWSVSGQQVGSTAFSVVPRSLNEASAEQAMSQELAGRYGNEYTDAAASWLKCPTAEIFSTEGTTTALCKAEFGSGNTRRFVGGSVNEKTGVSIFFSRRWSRHFHPCPRQFLSRRGIAGRLSINGYSCEGDALMVGDLAYALRAGHLGRHPVAYTHGTNTVGFDESAKLPCTVSGRGHKITCRNSLGDAFRYRVP